MSDDGIVAFVLIMAGLFFLIVGVITTFNWLLHHVRIV